MADLSAAGSRCRHRGIVPAVTWRKGHGNQSGTVRHPLQRKYPTAHGTVNLYCHPADTFIRRFRRSWGCCPAAWRKYWKFPWKTFSLWWKRPAHYDHVWYECCFLRIVWHTAGCCDLFHGSGQCRHYALFRTAAMCHRITDRSRCGSRLWHYTGNLSDQFYSGICTENRSDHRCICCVMRGGQHLILYDPAQCRTSV